MTGGRLALFIGGACVGVTTALLCAPRSGAATREKIRCKASEGEDFVKHHAEEIKHHADEIRKNIHETVERGKKAARTTGAGVVDAFQEGRAVLLR
jgi:gas vesicle protein